MAALTEFGLELLNAVRTDILEGYKQDKFCASLRKVLPLREDCAEIDGLLFVEGRLVIPKVATL